MDIALSPENRAGAIAGGTIAAVLLGVIVAHYLTRPSYFSLKDAVVLITGGSSGIGKSIAAECIKRGAHVALFARKLDLLEGAAAELRSVRPSPDQRVSIHSVDVTNDDAVHKAVSEAAAAHAGTVHALVCSAGTSQPQEFPDTTAAQFTQLLALNIVGCRNAVHASLPFMSSPRGGRVVLVSSQAGQVGLYGYTAYSASKFGLAGFAQALSMELAHRGILVSLAFPPDTDTPLLAEENQTKPAITRMLSESSATVKPEVVAKDVVAGMERWSPAIPTGFDGWMLATLTAGMGPAGTVLDALVQVLTMGLWRLVGLFYVQSFYFIVASGAKAGLVGKVDSRPQTAGGPKAAATGRAASAAKRTPAKEEEERKSK